MPGSGTKPNQAPIGRNGSAMPTRQITTPVIVSGRLAITGVVICLVGIALPFLPIGAWFGFVPLPGIYWLFLAVILAAYMALTQVVKARLIRRFGLL